MWVKFKATNKVVRMDALLQRYKELLSGANGGFAREYQLARSIAEKDPTYEARITLSTQEVTARNRYGNVVTLEDTRVKLTNVLPGESDYINASLVRHLDGPATIVAQAPTKHTAKHFWQMCWEQDVPIIVMLTNFDEPHGLHGEVLEKSYRYLALREQEAKSFGDYSVLCTSKCSLFDGWEERRLVITHEPTKKTKEVNHVHCIEWPDFGRLKESQLQGLNRGLELVQATRNMDRGPAIVHCSAGIGRSGTFVALENLLVQAKAKNGLKWIPQSSSELTKPAARDGPDG